MHGTAPGARPELQPHEAFCGLLLDPDGAGSSKTAVGVVSQNKSRLKLQAPHAQACLMLKQHPPQFEVIILTEEEDLAAPITCRWL